MHYLARIWKQADAADKLRRVNAYFQKYGVELFLKLILLFPITTLFQEHIGFLNKALFAVSLLVFFVSVCFKGKTLKYLLVVSGLWLISMLVTPLEALKLNVNMAVYYIFCVFYFAFFLDYRKKVWQLLKKNSLYVAGVVLLYTLVLTVSIFMPSSYAASEAGGWGDGAYFRSISGSPNRVGPASVFIFVLIIFLLKLGYRKLFALPALPLLYGFFMGGSRTYFVLGLCTAVILAYVLINNKRLFFLSLIPMGLAAVVLVSQSSMMDKLLATFKPGTDPVVFWQKLTNTRSIFWVEQLKLFFASPVLKQIFGNGVNFTWHQYGLWAHSDFIEILCSYGYLGLLNYLGLMVYSIYTFTKKNKNFFINCVCIFIWFFNAFFNFFYCYFCAMLCFPILLLAVQNIDAKVRKRKEAPREALTPEQLAAPRRVAVLMSSYNGEAYIEEQIDSILAQDLGDAIDLWVRDDGSTDTTLEILERYAQAGKLQWYRGENLGPARSFLDLVKHCPGYDFYAFADQDDYWMPDKVSSGVTSLLGWNVPAVYFANAELVDKELGSLGRNVYKRSPKLDFETLSCAGGILGCTMVFNQAMALQIQEKPLPERLPMHDFYVCLLCLALEGKMIFDPTAHIKYRQHGKNVVGVSSGVIGTIKSRLKDITKKQRVSIAVQAQQLLILHGKQMTEDKKKWLAKIRKYNDNLFNRVLLACSLKTQYMNWNMALKLRLSILFGNR